MKEKDLIRLVRNPRNIPGVHNYCDRWCERCPFTLRCANFAMGAAMDKDALPHDRAMESLWPRLEALLPVANELLVRHADHPGIPLAKDPIFKPHDRPLDSHRLGSAAKRYMEFTHAFVKEHDKTLPTLPPRSDGPAVTPFEAFDVINWYHTLLTVKLARALHYDEFDEELANDPEMADMPSDHDGSAKIALISMDRSILAWAALSVHVPELATTALSAMLTLNRLRVGVEKEFPKARAFVRAGFDTVRFPGK